MALYVRPVLGLRRQSVLSQIRYQTSSSDSIRSKKERLKQLREKLSHDDATGSTFGASSGARVRPQVQAANGLDNVKHVIAVTSCKGGVGKSTIATNLAFTMKNMGISVGLLDADVYGPSLPSIVQPEDARLLKTDTGRIRPVDYKGVPCMSFGWSSTGGGAAALRGPIVSGLVTQLATGTDWGSLDVLLVDMPPGTGDVHITLGQQVQMSAAIVVTTPQRLSLVDVVRGIDLLHTFQVPAIALVENMLYFDCDHGTRYNIFGPSVAEAITAQYGIPHTFGLPIDAAIAAASNNQLPLPMCDTKDPAVQRTLEVYREMARELLSELEAMPPRGSTLPSLSFDPVAGVQLRDGDRVASTSAKKLRCACLCAACVHEISREPLLDPDTVADTVAVENSQPQGNYAVQVTWSDRHSSIYPFNRLWDIME